MASSIPSTSTWFGNRNASTGTPFLNCVPRYALAATLIFGPGTGAFVDDLYLLRHQQDYKSMSRPLQVCIYKRTPAEDLARIREVFSLAVSDLAKTFSVSRQAIYNWHKGDQPVPVHINKLRDFANAADNFAETTIPATGKLLKRKIIEGKSLLEIIQEGGSASDAILFLKEIAQTERNQREKLASRFAGRMATISSVDSDLIAENDAV